jgi:hypothetical protein
MFYVDDELLAKLPEDIQELIKKEGKADVEDMSKSPEDMPLDKPLDSEEPMDDEFKLPKAQKYGEEDEFEDMIGDEGEMVEFPESKKNKISSFQDANERGNALISKLMDEAELEDMKRMKNKKVK